MVFEISSQCPKIWIFGKWRDNGKNAYLCGMDRSSKFLINHSENNFFPKASKGYRLCPWRVGTYSQRAEKETWLSPEDSCIGRKESLVRKHSSFAGSKQNLGDRAQVVGVVRVLSHTHQKMLGFRTLQSPVWPDNFWLTSELAKDSRQKRYLGSS